MSTPTRAASARLFSLACVLLLTFASSVEVAHAHRVALASLEKGVSATDSISSPDSNCPICLAAHSPAIAAAVSRILTFSTCTSDVLPLRAESHSHLSILVLTVRPPPQS
ncbi:MAG TPA: hypothetical protein VFM10_12515 [Terriglobales bacterium]|nr:hypothetical protein [Terriglobales bacterium]